MKLCALLIAGLTLTVSGLARAAEPAQEPSAPPSWYKKKKADQKAKEDERKADQLRMLERPDIGGAPADSGPPPESTISKPEVKVIETDHLFKRSGLTSSAYLGGGYVSQPEIPGMALAGSIAIGWWWKPNLVLMPNLRGDTIFGPSYTFVLIGFAPMLRYYLTKNWAISAEIGLAASIGLSKVTESRLPTPPEAHTLRTRNGPQLALGISRMFWTSRGFAIGPSLSLRYAKQDERSVFVGSIGITFQDARPDYTNGDLTQSDW